MPVKTQHTRSVVGTLACVAVLLCSGTSQPARDLDVGIPPGSPISFARRIPLLVPGTQVSFARSNDRPRTTTGAWSRAPSRGRNEDGPGLFRILTWDLEAHLPWLSRKRQQEPTTGRHFPAPSDSANWIVGGALLRLLLHPQLVSRHETVAHLVEIGEIAQPVLTAALVDEPALESVCRQAIQLIDAHPANPAPLPFETSARSSTAKTSMTKATRSAPPCGFVGSATSCPVRTPTTPKAGSGCGCFVSSAS